MHKTISIIILILTLVAFTKHSNKSFSFIPNGKSLISIKIENCDSTLHYTLLINKNLPSSQTLKPIDFNKDTTLNHKVDLNYPLHAVLYSKKEKVEFLLIPDNTLQLTLDYSKGSALKDVISYKGETSDISNYLTHHRKHLYSSPSIGESVDQYNQTVDDFYDSELSILDSLSNTIPQEFIELERANIYYERELSKSLQHGQRYTFHRQFISGRKQIDLLHMNYYWLNNATSLLAQIRPEKYDTLLDYKNTNADIFNTFCQDNIDTLKSLLNEKALSYYVAHRSSVLLNKKKVLGKNPTEYNELKNRVDGFITKNASLISDTLIYHSLLEHKQAVYHAYETRNNIKEGDRAPNFYLQDLNGKTLNLNTYKGQLILLNFWGTYCAPCIQSIPQKNELIDQLNKDDFTLINICTDNDFELWKTIIKDNEFKGEHVICKGQWNELLRSKYSINTIPHYTLIDRNGMILKNNIPGDSLKTYLEKHIQ